MLKPVTSRLLFTTILLAAQFLAPAASARPDVPDMASVNGKYANLIQTMDCPRDRAKYGNFRDYGYWAGGAWCGQTGQAGYWVWVSPRWYVWQAKGVGSGGGSDDVPAMASVNGKYSRLVQVMNCPRDHSKYGNFNDYGYWSGGDWCGQTGKAGYWVWVSPNWYVWKNR